MAKKSFFLTCLCHIKRLFCTQRSISALNFDAALEKSGKGVSIFASALDFSPISFDCLRCRKKRRGEIVWGGTTCVPPLQFRGGIPFQSFPSYPQPWTQKKHDWLSSSFRVLNLKRGKIFFSLSFKRGRKSAPEPIFHRSLLKNQNLGHHVRIRGQKLIFALFLLLRFIRESYRCVSQIKKARVWMPISCVPTCQKHRKKKIPPCNGRRHKKQSFGEKPSPFP